MPLHTLLVFLLLASAASGVRNADNSIVDFDAESFSLHYRDLLVQRDNDEPERRFSRTGRATILGKDRARLPSVDCHDVVGRCLVADNHYSMNDEDWVMRERNPYCSIDIKPVITYDHIVSFDISSHEDYFVLDWIFRTDAGQWTYPVDDGFKSVNMDLDDDWPFKARREVQIIYKDDCRMEVIYQENKEKQQTMEDVMVVERLDEIHVFFTDHDKCQYGRGFMTYDALESRDVGYVCFLEDLPAPRDLEHRLGSRVESVSYYDFLALDRNHDVWTGFMVDYSSQTPVLAFRFENENITGDALQVSMNYYYVLACYAQMNATSSSLNCQYLDIAGLRGWRNFTIAYTVPIGGLRLQSRRNGVFYILVNAGRELESQRDIYELWRLKIDGSPWKAEEKRWDMKVQRFLAPYNVLDSYIDHWEKDKVVERNEDNDGVEYVFEEEEVEDDDDDLEEVCVSFECGQQFTRLHATPSIHNYYFKRFFNKCFTKKDFEA